ncbi:hypothetical protein BH20ACT2_BH20ACT2_06110 [soil metagenome]
MARSLDDRGRFALAWAGGGIVALLVFAWMLSAGSWSFLQPQVLGDFYDTQADSLLDGHWDVDPGVVGIEGFVTDGRTYTYFGPVPALLRLPVAAFADGFDGRLTAPSMLVAFVVLLAFAGRLSWVVRRLVRADAALGVPELVVTALFALAFGCSTPLFLASRAWVYHEALLWGVALAVAAFDSVVRLLESPSRWRLVAAGALTTTALLTRVSVGSGPLATLGLLVLLGVVVRILPARPWSAAAAARLPLGLLAAAVVVPVVLYASINLVKFDSAFGLPMNRQVLSQFDEERRATLAANDGSYFGPQFVATALVQYVRPDALGFDRRFPWVTFPDRPIPVIGDVRFDALDRTTSLPTSLPALVALAAGGLAAVLRRRPSPPGVALLRLPLLGAAASTVTVLTIGFVANRYLSDFLPLVLLAALVGLHRLLALASERRGSRRPVVAAVALAAAGLAGTYVNGALALWYQGAYSDAIATDARTRFVALQLDVADALPGVEAEVEIRRGGRAAALPTDADDGDLFVVGACDALYWSDGSEWSALERRPPGGGFRLELQRAGRPEVGDRDELLTVGAPPDAVTVAVRYVDDDVAVVDRRLPDGSRAGGIEVHLDGDDRHAVDVTVDPRVGVFDAHVDGRRAMGAPAPIPDPATATLGSRVTLLAPTTDLCERVAG